MSLIARAVDGVRTPPWPSRLRTAAGVALAALAAMAVIVLGASLYEPLTAAAAAGQRSFHREIVSGLRALRGDGGLVAAWGLIAAGFVYGVLHAAGPGHGKAVLGTYLLSHPELIGRGVALGAAASLLQGVTAAALVYGALALAAIVATDTGAAVAWTERLSFALIAGLGAMLAIRAGRNLMERLRPGVPVAASGGCGHVRGHGHEAACGHVPSARDIASASGLRASLGVVAAIGVRPCSGAVMALALGHAMGLDWAGLAAVLAMSIGAGLAVCSIALLAVAARGHTARFLSANGGRGGALALDGAALLGGIAILSIGAALFAGSFGPEHPLGVR